MGFGVNVAGKKYTFVFDKCGTLEWIGIVGELQQYVGCRTRSRNLHGWLTAAVISLHGIGARCSCRQRIELLRIRRPQGAILNRILPLCYLPKPIEISVDCFFP